MAILECGLRTLAVGAPFRQHRGQTPRFRAGGLLGTLELSEQGRPCFKFARRFGLARSRRFEGCRVRGASAFRCEALFQLARLLEQSLRGQPLFGCALLGRVEVGDHRFA